MYIVQAVRLIRLGPLQSATFVPFRMLSLFPPYKKRDRRQKEKGQFER